MIYLLENDDFPCFLRKRHRRTDGRTDGRTDIPGYRDARTHLKRRMIYDKLRLSVVYRKCFIFTECHKIVMDRPTDRPMDGPPQRDAGMPLKICSGIVAAFLRFHLLKTIDFPRFLQKRHGRTDGQTDTLVEMRGRM